MKEAFESKGVSVNLRKTKVLVSSGLDDSYKSKVAPCGSAA